MTEFLAAILSFPTVLFTILLGVTVVYWLFVMLGALDVDLLGSGDGIDGDGDVDGDDAGGLSGAIQAVGLGGVPLTLSLSLLILASWVLCVLATQALGGSAAWLLALAAGLAFVVAVPLTAVAVRPLRRFFVSHAATASRSLLGKVCTITTLRVDERYGQAEIEDGGAGLLVQVRSFGPRRLERGDKALIFDYKDEVFHVSPLDEAMRKSLADLG